MGKVLFSEPIYVFSDSKRVVGICVAKGYHRILGGKIGHVSFADSESSEDKTMLDFFLQCQEARKSMRFYFLTCMEVCSFNMRQWLEVLILNGYVAEKVCVDMLLAVI